MNTRKMRFWVLGGALLLVAGVVVGWLGLTGHLPWQKGTLYEDLQGRFTMQVDRSWEQVPTDGRYAQFKVPDPPMQVYLLVLETRSINAAFSQAIEVVGFDPGLLSGGSTTNFGDWQAYGQEDAAGLSYGLAGQVVGENSYVVIVKGDRPGVSTENAAVLRALSSLKIAGKQNLAIESYADVEALLRKQVDSLAGSVSVAVVHKGQIVYTYAYGKANPVKGIAADTQTIYAFGSMTKIFTASALMQLVEKGLVDLDAWPGEYVPEFPESWNVTVRQLLTHSACLPDNNRLTLGLIALPGESFAPLSEVFSAYVKDYPDLVCEPGKVSQYSNPHYLALARIIEEASREPYETYVVDHILTPLAMDSTGFALTEADARYAKGQYPVAGIDELAAQLNEYHGADQAAIILQKGGTYATLADYRILPPWGGLRGTPSDVTHFLQMYLDKGRYADTQVLQPETIASIQTMQSSKDGSPLGLGLGWWIDKDSIGKFLYHDGGAKGVETTLRFYPDLDLGVVVMGNVAGYQSDHIAEGLARAWKNEK